MRKPPLTCAATAIAICRVQMKMPGHAESYNPPAEYLWTKEEEEAFLKMAPEALNPLHAVASHVTRRSDCLMCAASASVPSATVRREVRVAHSGLPILMRETALEMGARTRAHGTARHGTARHAHT